jgi:hypothetical protein
MANGLITSPIAIVNNLFVWLAQMHAISFLLYDHAEESFRKWMFIEVNVLPKTSNCEV